jgi:hypothetical protein
LKIKYKDRHDTLVEIEAESQAVQNMTSRMHLKNGRSTGNGGYAQKGTTLKVMVASRQKLVFDQMVASVPKLWIALCMYFF